MIKTKMQILRHTRPILRRDRWLEIGYADLNSTYTMPVWKDRKYCIQESKSKYIAHQGSKECQRRAMQMNGGIISPIS